MNIRKLIVTGAACALFSVPAIASDITGWYFDLGAGWDRMNNLEGSGTGSPPATVGDNDSALIIGGVGYKFANRLRVEFEAGWDDHNVSQPGFGGDVQIRSALFNVAYDFP